MISFGAPDFFQACERAEFSKSCNLIGSESGRFFTILPANPGGIIGSLSYKFCLCTVGQKVSTKLAILDFFTRVISLIFSL